MRRLFYFIAVAFIILTSCTPTEKLKYTVNTEDSANEFFNDRSEKTIQPYDYLYIRIYSLDNATADIFNNNREYGNTNENLHSYEVNDQGYIYFPFIGKILVKDLTIEQAKQKLENELNKYLTNISLRVRFIGNKITVIGEVNRPGNYTFYDEKITVFQGLGLAGDIANYGNKTNVALLREKNDTLKYHYLDLTSKDIVRSEYYYLLPNDVIIVEPVNAKFRALQDRSLIYLIVSVLTSTTTTAVSILNYTKD